MEKVLYEVKPYGLIILGLIGLYFGYKAILGVVCSLLLIIASSLILRLRYECRTKR